MGGYGGQAWVWEEPGGTLDLGAHAVWLASHAWLAVRAAHHREDAAWEPV